VKGHFLALLTDAICRHAYIASICLNKAGAISESNRSFSSAREYKRC
jgi:hypothetical protein